MHFFDSVQAQPTEAVYLHDASLRTPTTEIVSYQPVSLLAEEETFLAKIISPEDSTVIMQQAQFRNHIFFSNP
jgi:ethanolamine utilization microcompartment shell protein EutL